MDNSSDLWTDRLRCESQFPLSRPLNQSLSLLICRSEIIRLMCGVCELMLVKYLASYLTPIELPINASCLNKCIIVVNLSSSSSKLYVLPILCLANSYLPLQCQFRSVLISKYFSAYCVSHTSSRLPSLMPLDWIKRPLRQLVLIYSL